MHTLLLNVGAGMGIVLSIIKAWETFRDLPRIVISSHFSIEEIGDSITITNLSNKAINIDGYTLFLAKSKRRKREYDYIETGNEGFPFNLQIQAFSNKTLTFTDQYRFSDSIKRLKGKKLYMTLYIIGRKRPVTKYVTSF